MNKKNIINVFISQNVNIYINLKTNIRIIVYDTRGHIIKYNDVGTHMV